MRRKLLFTIVLLLPFFMAFSQEEDETDSEPLSYSFEADVHLGAVSFNTDYGISKDVEIGTVGNVGFAIGASVYMNFFKRDLGLSSSEKWLSKHLKLKAKLSYLRADLKFNEDRAGTSEKLLAISGSTSVISLAAIAEYHYFDLTDFNALNKNIFSPYVGIGPAINFSRPTFETSLGDYISRPEILPLSFQNEAIATEPEAILSLVLSLGTRIKTGEKSDLIIDSEWQYFASDKIDGLDVPGATNTKNDWMYHLSLGYVFYFD